MLFLGDDLIPEALFVATFERQPVALASLRRADRSQAFELGWVGVSHRHQERAPELTLALVGRCIAYARDRDTVIDIEVDEEDRHLWRLVSELPLNAEPDWLTFTRPVLTSLTWTARPA